MLILILKILGYIVGGLVLFLIVGLVLTHISHVRDRKRKPRWICGTPFVQAQAEQTMFQKLADEYKIRVDEISELWRRLYSCNLEDFFMALTIRDQESMTRFILDTFLEKQDILPNTLNIEKVLDSEGQGILKVELRKYYSEYTLSQLEGNDRKV